jgi:tripartite-type tricarboxylate transporter receptor subunit TctC
MRLVVGVPAGGANDTVARALAQPLSRALGQSVIVENRPGASSVIAAEYVVRSPADGNTVFLAGFAFMANAVLRPKLPYDTHKDFAALAGIGANPLIISIHPSVPAKTMKELIAFARTRPGQLTYATPGSGFPQHLAGEMLKLTAKIDLLHVPYQGGAPATVAVLGGHTQILISTIPLAAQHLASGKLRPLAVTSATRSELMKDVPTVAESGVPDYELTSVFGAFVRSTTPKAAIDRLSVEILRALQVPEVKASLLRDGYTLAPLGPAEFDAVVRAKTQQIQKIVKEAKIKID